MDVPVIKLDEVIKKFFHIKKDKILNKSPNQIRKWENPRKRAISNLINCVGNKAVHEITRQDILKFRDWWIERLKNENLLPNTVNKYLIHVKTIITTIADNMSLNFDTEKVFKKSLMKKIRKEDAFPLKPIISEMFFLIP